MDTVVVENTKLNDSIDDSDNIIRLSRLAQKIE